MPRRAVAQDDGARGAGGEGDAGVVDRGARGLQHDGLAERDDPGDAGRGRVRARGRPPAARGGGGEPQPACPAPQAPGYSGHRYQPVRGEW